MKTDTSVRMRKGTRSRALSGFVLFLFGAIPLASRADTEFTTVFEFGNGNGTGPRNGIIRAADGRFYGVRQNPAEIFGVNVNGSGFSSLHTFAMNEGGYQGAIQASDTKLYGAGYDGGAGFLYRINTNGTSFQKIYQFPTLLGGQTPTAPPLEASDGNLYGFVSDGTFFGHGGIYRIAKDGTSYQAIITLTGTGGLQAGAFDGGFGGSLIQVGNDLYGVTPLGGANNVGVIFKLTIIPSVSYTVLHEFTYSEGAYMGDTLYHASDGRLYGVANSGGLPGDFGTVFRINLDGTGFRVLHRFNDTDGNDPSGDLIEGDDGRLYGTCFRGGAPGENEGVVFRIKLDGTGHAVVHRFATTNDKGTQPEGGLVKVGANTYYGATTFGVGDGTIFRIVTTQSPPAIFGKKKKRFPATRKRVTLRGRAADDLDVASVVYKVRGKGGLRLAKGNGERWRIRLKPTRRRTVVRAFAMDYDDNRSPMRRFVVLLK